MYKAALSPDTKRLLAELDADLSGTIKETTKLDLLMHTVGMASGPQTQALVGPLNVILKSQATNHDKLRAVRFVIHGRRDYVAAASNGAAGAPAAPPDNGAQSEPDAERATLRADVSLDTVGLAAPPPAAGAPPPTPPNGSTPYCTPRQLRSRLVPQSSRGMASWAPRRYGPKCGTIGKNYRCRGPSHLEFVSDVTNRQVPIDAAEGRCRLHTDAAGKYPFPAGSRVLFWGNSHMREIIHSLACQFSEAEQTTRGSSQTDACSYADYTIEDGKDETLFKTEYGNGATAYGVCNCGLMYDRATSLPSVSRLLGMDISTLTHVVANPANVAKWATQWAYKKCNNAPFASLRNKSNAELFAWHPYRTPGELGEALRQRGFRGKLIWTLPFWCMNNSKANRYRYDVPATEIQDNEYVDGVVDFSAFICPDEKFRCETAGCSKGRAGSHQCLPGPPDDIASAVLHLVATM